jgi:butyryl-CoA dehydrogenase
MDTLKWLLNDVHSVVDLFKYERYQDYDKDSVDILLDTAKSWSDQEFYPIFREMDENPCKFVDGQITSHPNLNRILKKAGDDGWIGNTFDYDDGGSQMPHAVANATNHIFQCANNHIPGYMGLTTGAADLIRTFGVQALKDKYIPKMMSGDWGSFKISGQKIFISGGDHQAASNFVHLVLARIDGAPAGTKGISLFVVPKHMEGDDGTLSYNNVETISEFEKMGQRGYATVHLVFGEKGDCIGHLVGQEGSK